MFAEMKNTNVKHPEVLIVAYFTHSYLLHLLYFGFCFCKI